MSLKQQIRFRACEFMASLTKLKAEIKNEEAFRHALADLHKSYVRFMVLATKTNALEKEKMHEQQVVDCINGITRYSIGRFEFLCSEVFGVISVSMGDCSVDRHVLCMTRKVPIEQQVRVVADLMAMYIDYESLPCDICAEYAIMPGFDTPLQRIAQEDFVLSCHSQCMMPCMNKTK
ncbi:hypothetical protein CWI42_080670 [Ordospora colligata]|uniref:Uncharacterized protein n=1 Tax=Ordospora colligata OC4 TaxID=1354746 RepID=A0A0B2UJ31_9MICR|nr:uncharacterized protein M896_080680 [Ordospora colligata OC4]KHN69333.1 hypothetical protein M896_080680 [Ordospora colligata OC4]TBU14847.1 hypothetical protein CWI41_080670 [Ordospora colligata]TBU14978.1 hypothetical protein CWI40_080690 [Ordospora colligata]TBU18362.1 hypothetical protein CWI42_080670 [Ordospora colligata]